MKKTKDMTKDELIKLYESGKAMIKELLELHSINDMGECTICETSDFPCITRQILKSK
jgi:hypothetical protein